MQALIKSVLIVLVLCVASPSWAAFAERAGSKATGANNATDSVAVAYAQNVVAGNLLVVGGGIWNAPNTSSLSITGSLHGSGWTVSYVSIGSNFTAYLAWRVATSSGAETVTVDPSGTGAYIEVAVNEYTAGAAIEIDAALASTTGTSAAPSRNVVTTTTAGLIVGVVVPDTDTIGAPTVLTPGGSYTQWAETESTANAEYNAQHRITSSATTYAVDWTMGNSGPWGIMTAAFKESGGGGSPPPPPSRMLMGVGK